MRYALIAYVASWIAANLLIALLGLVVELHVGARVLIVDVILLAALIPLRRSGGVTSRDLGVRRVPGARSVGYALLALIVVLIFDMCWKAIVPYGVKASAANPFVGVSHEDGFNIALTAFAAALSAPVVEEIFFRGLLYRSLRNRLPFLSAALIAGAMFGLVHAGAYPLVSLPAKAFFGIVVYLLYERTGSLLPGIAVHSFVDAASFEGTVTSNVQVVMTVFLLLAAVLLVRPPLKGLGRLLTGRPVFRAGGARSMSDSPGAE
ncbi:MAG TPA: type II CAAX endopeptidase family protein [Solirubrobacteraceae bacterium]|nr:type II CAAX endopeptidase family protein [Solirubrobacteraceae bacterium]